MGDPVWLPDVLRAEGLPVVELGGWRNRGHGDFGNIWGVVCHHTGSNNASPESIAFHPSLGLASQLHLSRSGVYTVCGAGVAWHAGSGSWPGIPSGSANQVTIGIEAANDGGGAPGKPHRWSWPDAQYDAYVRGVAAILRKLGQPASHAIAHKEWAGVAQGKWDPGAIDMNIFRDDVQRVIVKVSKGWLDMPDAQQMLKDIHDKVMAYPDVPGLRGRWPSRSMFADSSAGVDDTAGLILNTDGNSWNLVVVFGALIGVPQDVARVRRAARGEFPPNSYVAGNDWLRNRTIEFAKTLEPLCGAFQQFAPKQ